MSRVRWAQELQEFIAGVGRYGTGVRYVSPIYVGRWDKRT
jgi:hypothetical protein